MGGGDPSEIIHHCSIQRTFTIHLKSYKTRDDEAASVQLAGCTQSSFPRTTTLNY